MTKSKVKALGIFSTAVVVTVGLAACSSNSSSSGSEKWKIGVEAPLTGSQANLGQGMLQGAQLAADQINAEGGILGKQIEIVQIDDAADPDTGVTAANAAIADGLNGVVGPYNSSVGVKTLPLYIKAGVVPMRLTSVNKTDGQGFTLQPMTNQIAPVTSQALTKFYQAKSVGIIYDSTQNYTTSTSAAVKKQLEDAGVKVTSYTAVKPGEDSYSSVVDQVKAKNPDVIYPAVYFPEGAKIAKELTPQSGGKATKCLLDYASYDTGYIQDAGKEAAQTCEVVGVPAPSDFKDSADKVDAFHKQFNQAPGTWSPYTFDSLKLLVDGANKVGNFDATPLTDQLKTTKDWQGWTGSVTIDPKTGNRTPATVVVTKVDANGEFHVDSDWAKVVGAPY
ncbi:MAG: branched-chain amino acid ABC transporter substrate-binding protein [Candidatus Nanopelagicales bacterium]